MSKKDRLSTDSYKGVRDFYPEDMALLNYIFATCRRVAKSFGYVEYGASILEPAELYKAKGSENEEIVNEQTYTFVDRGEREVTLRPEMTPTVARMVAAKRRELGFPLRLFSIPNLFRYERPQRGRLREHWQLNVDLFGSKSTAADAEILSVAYELMKAFGAKDEHFIIKLGSRPWLDEQTKEFDDKKRQAFYRCLDARGKMDADAFKANLEEIGVSEDILTKEPPTDITHILAECKASGINNVVWDPSIVRGFSYYSGMVFEVFDTHPDNNRSLFGGGRYDNLTALFDDEPVPGVGFGMGDVTIRDFLAVRDLLPPYIPTTKVYLAITDPSLAPFGAEVARELRAANVSAALDFGEKKLADQIKAAAKHHIPYLVVLGEEEQHSDTVVVRDLRTGEEKSVGRAELPGYLNSL